MSIAQKRLKAIVSHSYPIEHKYAEELMATAKAIGSPGKGILAADESTGTIGKRFKGINVANTRVNRRAYRNLLATTKGLGKNISGVILFEETLFEKLEDGSKLVDGFTREGIILGIKVDKGTRKLLGTDGELYTQGLTDLDQRCASYYKAGARFAKWRAVVKISKTTPSLNAINETAHSLARYAALCQANGLVPIVEPEILMDGDHDIATCQYWTEKVVSACYAALKLQGVLLEGTLLKPNMCLPGKAYKGGKATPEECAAATVTALQRSVPVPVPAITFLSGGQSEEEATLNLNALNAPGLGFRPWSLTFSFGRALQQSVLKAWKGRRENTAAAQKELLVRAAANGAANLGKYKGEAAGGAAASTSTYVKNYTY